MILASAMRKLIHLSGLISEKVAERILSSALKFMRCLSHGFFFSCDIVGHAKDGSLACFEFV